MVIFCYYYLHKYGIDVTVSSEWNRFYREFQYTINKHDEFEGANLIKK